MFTPVAPQLAIAGYLDSGGVDHTLRRMRRVYALRTEKMADAVLRNFPDGTQVSSPQGGYVFWVKLPEAVDSLELYRQGLAQGITIAPGYLFASDSRYHNYIRLNAAMLLDETGWAVERLGELANGLLPFKVNWV